MDGRLGSGYPACLSEERGHLQTDVCVHPQYAVCLALASLWLDHLFALPGSPAARPFMGFSDTATYLQASSLHEVGDALISELRLFGYEFQVDAVAEEHVPAYFPVAALPTLTVWVHSAERHWRRLYCNHCGLFAFHLGDNLPLIERIVRRLGTQGFAFSIEDGESASLLETCGYGYRLTGAHLYALEEAEIELTEEGVAAAAGKHMRFCSTTLRYDSTEVDPGLIGDLKQHQFWLMPNDTMSAMEHYALGRALPAYHETRPGDGEIAWRFHRVA